ncbi:hypothetical protein LLG95_15050, partial [bacterium]|nr:hypothetical protein [bacterium]
MIVNAATPIVDSIFKQEAAEITENIFSVVSVSSCLRILLRVPYYYLSEFCFSDKILWSPLGVRRVARNSFLRCPLQRAERVATGFSRWSAIHWFSYQRASARFSGPASAIELPELFRVFRVL